MLVPAIGAVRKNAARGRTRSQFHQYMVAYESFKAEYGYYPGMGEKSNVFKLKGRNEVFIETLTGHAADGLPMTNAQARASNPKALRFYSFGQAEFGPKDSAYPGQIVDSFDNPNIVAVIDRNRDGLIALKDLAEVPGGDRPTDLHGGVFFYSDNTENNPDWEWIYSWQ